MPALPDYFNDYEAKKIDTTRLALQAEQDALEAVAPDWFKFEAGFTFWYDGGLCIFVGPGGYRRFGSEEDTYFSNKGILYTWLYKGEWHFSAITARAIPSFTQTA